MADRYAFLVRGATLKCSDGSHARKLNLPLCHGAYSNEHPFVYDVDCVPIINIPSFGICTSKTNPGVASGTPSVPCVPVIIGKWLNPHPNMKIATNESVAAANGDPFARSYANALTMDSFLICTYFGVITPEDSGQKDVLTINKADLGDIIGSGGNKEVFSYGGDKAVAILKDGKPVKSIDDELALLNQLDELGLPTVKAEKVIVDGKPGMIMDKFSQGSKDIVKLESGKIKIVGNSPLLNQNSVDDLTKIKNTMIEKNIKVDDLQFLIREDGHIVISDPLNVISNSSPSKNNLRMIDLLIEQAKG